MPDDGVSIGIDWVRMTGRDLSWWKYALRVLESWFGTHDEIGGKINFYGKSLRWKNGVQVWYEPLARANETGQMPAFVVEVPGKALAPLNGTQRVHLLSELDGLGLRCSRIDLAADFVNIGEWEAEDEHGQLIRSTLVECVDRSRKTGERTGFRRHTAIQPMNGNRIVGHTVYLGHRGADGSGKFTRIYDKGLQAVYSDRVASPEQIEHGQWERWEVEYIGDVAVQVVESILDAGTDDSEGGSTERAMGQLIMGGHQFRKVTGRRELARRPFVAWFARAVEMLGGAFRVDGRRVASTLNRTVGWLRDGVAGVIDSLAKAAGWSLEQTLASLVAGVECSEAQRKHRRVDEWRAWLKGQTTALRVPEAIRIKAGVAA